MPSHAQNNQKALALPFSLREQLYLTWLPAGYMPVMHWVHRLVMNQEALQKFNKMIKPVKGRKSSNTIDFLIGAIKICLACFTVVEDSNPPSDALLRETHSFDQLRRDLAKLPFNVDQHTEQNIREISSKLAIDVMQNRRSAHLILFSGLRLYQAAQSTHADNRGLQDYLTQSATGLLLYYFSDNGHAKKTISSYTVFMAVHRNLSLHIQNALHGLYTHYGQQTIDTANTFLNAYYHHQFARYLNQDETTKTLAHPLCPAVKHLVYSNADDRHTVIENNFIHSVLYNTASPLPGGYNTDEKNNINIIICLATLSSYYETVAQQNKKDRFNNKKTLEAANHLLTHYTGGVYVKKRVIPIFIATLLAHKFFPYLVQYNLDGIVLAALCIFCFYDCVHLNYKSDAICVENTKALTDFLAGYEKQSQAMDEEFSLFYRNQATDFLPYGNYQKERRKKGQKIDSKEIADQPTVPDYRNPYTYYTWPRSLVKKVRLRLPKQQSTQETNNQGTQTQRTEKYSFTWIDEHDNKYRYDHPVDALQNNHQETILAHPIAQNNLPKNMHPACYAAVSPTLIYNHEQAAELAASTISSGTSFVRDRDEQGIKWENGIPVLKYLGKENGDTRFPLTMVASEQAQQLMPGRAPQYATLYLANKPPMDHQELHRYIQQNA